MPTLLKLRFGTFSYASRDMREMFAAKEAGYTVSLLARPAILEDDGKTEVVDGITYSYLGHPPDHSILGEPFFRRYSIIIKFWYSWFTRIRHSGADVISCHDLPALRLAYWFTLFIPKSRKPKLVYDSHEFELGRNIERSKFKQWRTKRQERFLMKRCAFSIMVNDSIADEVQKIHHLKERSLVVRSTPDLWSLDENVMATRRKEMLSQLGFQEPAFLVMYHGIVTTGRGIEQLLQVIRVNPHIAGVILGLRLESDYGKKIQKMAADLGVQNRVLFLPAVPVERIWEYSGAVDIETVLFQNNFKSYYYTLPNKFFEAIQSLTPVLASNFPELNKLIDKYNIGLTCDPADIDALNACVEKMRTDKILYQTFKQNLAPAKNDLCWANEKQILITAYKNLFPQSD